MSVSGTCKGCGKYFRYLDMGYDSCPYGYYQKRRDFLHEWGLAMYPIYNGVDKQTGYQKWYRPAPLCNECITELCAWVRAKIAKSEKKNGL